ncbi:RHS repeat-associated core domain-containing protein [Arcobacter sp. HD9-500m-PIT-SAG02]|nr:RHS repeat-associated core domain-containing protein [Arcobacter sp. HD9-500m-PIT-SAG02]RDX34861.1 RHS repeat-associated core domain-containing protein [Arcobacter sp. HD9-500m-PIT-SAG03]
MINNITTGTGSKLLRDIKYIYNKNNSVINRTDTINGLNESFSYDEYDRLKSWKKNNNEVKYQYDIYGNMIDNSSIGSMTYNAKNQLLSTNTRTYSSNHYDLSGNMISDNVNSYEYTSFNKISKINSPDKIITMSYDSSNNLALKETENKTIYYVNKTYELEVIRDTQDQEVIIMRHHLQADGKLIAIHEKTKINEKKQVDKTAYIHKDALNSVDLITNAKGKIVLKQQYTPFGKVILQEETENKINKENIRGYTGHKHLYDLGLIDMGGRMYNPSIGKFLSGDPFIQDSINSQNYNRYTYVMNNPLKYTDPTGYLYDSGIEDGRFTGGQGDDALVMSDFHSTVVGFESVDMKWWEMPTNWASRTLLYYSREVAMKQPKVFDAHWTSRTLLYYLRGVKIEPAKVFHAHGSTRSNDFKVSGPAARLEAFVRNKYIFASIVQESSNFKGPNLLVTNFGSGFGPIELLTTPNWAAQTIGSYGPATATLNGDIITFRVYNNMGIDSFTYSTGLIGESPSDVKEIIEWKKSIYDLWD